MKLKELRLLEVNVYDGDNLVYSGMTEQIPEELKEKNIKIEQGSDKKINIKLI